MCVSQNSTVGGSGERTVVSVCPKTRPGGVGVVPWTERVCPKTRLDAPLSFTRNHGTYDVVDVCEEECRPLFPVRPWALRQAPVSGSVVPLGVLVRVPGAGIPRALQICGNESAATSEARAVSERVNDFTEIQIHTQHAIGRLPGCVQVPRHNPLPGHRCPNAKKQPRVTTQHTSR